ncbi:MAG: sulfate adenylyltransferase [Methanobacteriota archaeon]|nr:MAG: sulfate adenylyltransferase [Euryarchaeota archaeon]
MTLRSRIVEGRDQEELKELEKGAPTIMIDEEAWITSEMIAVGALSPLHGFMTSEDYRSVLEEGRLSDGHPFPVVLSFAPAGKRNAETIKSQIKEGDTVLLINQQKEGVATLEVEEKWRYDKKERAQKIFGTTDEHHPGVRQVYQRMGDVSLAGHLTVYKRPDWGPFEPFRKTPEESREAIRKQKARDVVAFWTGANPVHRGHEHIQRNLMEHYDMLMAVPLVNMAKKEQITPEYRVACYEVLFKNYYPKHKVLLLPQKITYIFAGPREAVLHAIISRNYGATAIAFGRDYAGIGDYFGKYEAHTAFDEYDPGELGIKPVFFREVYYCVRCGHTVTDEVCKHGEEFRIGISGTGIRDLMRYGFLPPKEIVRPEIARLAIQGVVPKGLGPDGMAVGPPGKVIKRLFPFYLVAHRLGGQLRHKPLDWQGLDINNIRRALKEVRENSERILKDIYREVEYEADIDRSLTSKWVQDATVTAAEDQKLAIDLIRARLETAATPEEKAEIKKELDVAQRILKSIGKVITDREAKERVWNLREYGSYR